MSGYKTFVDGSDALAADANGYLMEQVIMGFASASARDTALSGHLQEGMHAYLRDVNALYFYDGAAWQRTSYVLACQGTVSIACVNGTAVQSAAQTFPFTFPSAPKVYVVCETATYGFTGNSVSTTTTQTVIVGNLVAGGTNASRNFAWTAILVL